MKSADGMMTSGTGIQSTLASDALIETLEDFYDNWKNDPDRLKTKLGDIDFECSDQPCSEFAFLPSGAGVVETMTKTFIPIFC